MPPVCQASGRLLLQAALRPSGPRALDAVLPQGRTDERLTSRRDFRALLRRGGVDILQPDVSVTGLGELVKVCHPGEAHDVAVVPHCSDGPVSPAASPQVSGVALNVPPHEQGLGLHCNTGCAGLPRGEMADYLLGPAPLVPVDGAVALPAGRAPASRATRRRCVPGTASGATPMRGGAIRTGGSRSGDGRRAAPVSPARSSGARHPG
jgi:hypothetical protein